MKKTSLFVLIAGTFLVFAFASCSKSCDCKLVTHTDTYEVNYHLKGYEKYGVSDCSGLALHLEQAAWNHGGERINVICNDSGRLF